MDWLWLLFFGLGGFCRRRRSDRSMDRAELGFKPPVFQKYSLLVSLG